MEKKSNQNNPSLSQTAGSVGGAALGAYGAHKIAQKMSPGYAANAVKAKGVAGGLVSKAWGAVKNVVKPVAETAEKAVPDLLKAAFLGEKAMEIMMNRPVASSATIGVLAGATQGLKKPKPDSSGKKSNTSLRLKNALVGAAVGGALGGTYAYSMRKFTGDMTGVGFAPVSKHLRDLEAPPGGFKTKAEAGAHYLSMVDKYHGDKSMDHNGLTKSDKIIHAWKNYMGHPNGFRKLAFLTALVEGGMDYDLALEGLK